jgi:hypothetical protein
MACSIEIEKTINKSIDEKLPNKQDIFSKNAAKKISDDLNNLWGFNLTDVREHSGIGGYKVIVNNFQKLVDRELIRQKLAEKTFERDLDFFNGDVALMEQEFNDPIEQGEIDDVDYGISQETKEGVSDIFKQSPELASIGTSQEYSAYLDSIFPNSKVKDIVYHGTTNKKQIFTEGFKNNSELYPSDDDRAYESGELGYGYYFTPSQKAAKNYGEIVAVILNNPDITNETTFNLITNERGIQHFVKTQKQIHILGSKQDIEGFKDWVNSKDDSNQYGISQESIDEYKKQCK